jgi:hypothetical protein
MFSRFPTPLSSCAHKILSSAVGLGFPIHPEKDENKGISVVSIFSTIKWEQY